MKQKFQINSVSDFQQTVLTVYGYPDDRLFSLSDLLSNQQKFAMRALKGIRKNDSCKLQLNLLISLAWCMAIANRLHINVEDCIWNRFPLHCSYCGKKPCGCKKDKKKSRSKVLVTNPKLKPSSIQGYQQMFEKIYPSLERSLAGAGIHFAEETGELSEAIHSQMGTHDIQQFKEIELEMSDFVSCFFGVANSAQIHVQKELQQMFGNGCHSCHSSPCRCSFDHVAHFKS